MYKYIFSLACVEHDCIYDISPYSFAKAYACISRGFAYRAFFEDEQKMLVVREQLIQYILKNVDAEHSTSLVGRLEDTQLEQYRIQVDDSVEEVRGRTNDNSTRKRKASKSPEREDVIRRRV